MAKPKNNTVHLETIELNAMVLDLLKTLNQEDLWVCIRLIHDRKSFNELCGLEVFKTHPNAVAIYRTIIYLNDIDHGRF